ncbi:MAG: hypothetical protein JWR65_3816 [Massilia sp.]|jgi:hypothetical protein|nr:hypothetical protein [Massilia sp.]
MSTASSYHLVAYALGNGNLSRHQEGLMSRRHDPRQLARSNVRWRCPYVCRKKIPVSAAWTERRCSAHRAGVRLPHPKAMANGAQRRSGASPIKFLAHREITLPARMALLTYTYWHRSTRLRLAGPCVRNPGTQRPAREAGLLIAQLRTRRYRLPLDSAAWSLTHGVYTRRRVVAIHLRQVCQAATRR